MDAVYDRTGFPRDFMNFSYKNKVFNEKTKATLEELGVVENCLIHLIPHLSGKLVGGWLL